MLTRLAFFFTEAIRSVMTNLATSIAAVVAMTVSLVVLGLFFAVLLGVNSLAKDVEESAARVKVFLADTATEGEVNQLREAMEADERIGGVIYVSKDDALKRAEDLFGDKSDILENLPVNPFPASLEGDVVDTTRISEVAATFEERPGVYSVEYGGERSEAVISFARWVQWTSLVLASVLLLASTILVSNTIRLSIFARRREIEVMKLVGASNSFVRVPFMIEGFLFGFLGAIGAVAMLGGLAMLLQRFIVEQLSLVALPADLMANVALTVLAVGVVLGSLGSGVTIRRFLRV